MSAAKIARLADRGVVSVEGSDSEKLLQSLVTNDIEGLEPGSARHTALLSPQGKILFDFFVVRTERGYLLDVAAAKAADLSKRLAMYKLRADVAIRDQAPRFAVFAAWNGPVSPLSGPEDAVFTDPRHPELGLRLLKVSYADDAACEAPSATRTAPQEYDALRVDLGVPEGGKDYEFGDAYPHEADFDLLNGVSFSKGCFVGQEVVARMQNKTVVRKRVVKIAGAGPLTSGENVLLGDVVIGRVGTVSGRNALAMLRLDRAAEAEEKNLNLTAGGIAVSPEAKMLARYRASASSRSSTAAMR